jgi:seryl-tRNA synthetase
VTNQQLKTRPTRERTTDEEVHADEAPEVDTGDRDTLLAETDEVIERIDAAVTEAEEFDIAAFAAVAFGPDETVDDLRAQERDAKRAVGDAFSSYITADDDTVEAKRGAHRETVAHLREVQAKLRDRGERPQVGCFH